MAESLYEFERFFNREGFNRALSHFQAVSSLLDDFEDAYNLADILNSLLAAKEIEQEQLSPILYALLVDKYGYRIGTWNARDTIDDFEHLAAEAARWNAVDVVVAYHHPELGFTVINPKNRDHWAVAQNIRKNELVSIYAGGFSSGVSEKVADKAIETCIRYLEGKKTKSPAILLDGEFGYVPYEEETEPLETPARRTEGARPRSKREPVRASVSESGEEAERGASAAEKAPSAGTPEPATGAGRRMTPMYSVPVSNELFHNGNVEAWKKIIQSYQLKYPNCEVLVFYEGERIHDINTLFKWGKVKHGSTILFAVVGETIKDVAKLQRYFKQGASPQFEAFLRVPVNTVLKLF